MFKKGNLYYPSKEFKKNAWIQDGKIYKTAAKDPIKFWGKAANEIYWKKKWKKIFEHKPPYFQWFLGGKLNITENALDRHLKKSGDKTAVIWEPEPANEQSKKLTYKELFSAVCRLANGLKKLGVKKGDRVGIYLPMIPEAVISILACARIGAVHSVVFSAFSPRALKVRLQDTQAEVLITADGYFRRGQMINLKESADQGIEETEVRKVIVVKRAGNEISWKPERDLWWEDVTKNENNYCRATVMDAEDLLFLLATSGSTGRPKQIMHTCGGYAVHVKITGKWIFDFKENDILWCTSDLGWISGHSYIVYSPLLNGITTLIFEGALDWPGEDRWAKVIEKHKATIFYTAPTAIRMFEKYGAEILEKYEFKNLRLLGSVGEPIDEAAWLWYFENVGKKKCPIVDTWWQTETGGILITPLPGLGPFKPASAGLPFPGTRFDILNEEGKSLAVNKKGNLVMLPPFAPGLLRGIYKNPEKYLETYWSQYGDKVYFTSDAAKKDEKGLIRIIGRVDDVIKVAGHRLTTGELEAAVNLHPAITECAAIAVPDKIKGEAPVVFAVSSLASAKDGSENLKKEIIDQARKTIGPIALPKEVYLVEDLPKTRSGKIMRRILKRLLIGEELGDLSTISNPESIEKIKAVIKK